jgi:hypothetical protein
MDIRDIVRNIHDAETFIHGMSCEAFSLGKKLIFLSAGLTGILSLA